MGKSAIHPVVWQPPPAPARARQRSSQRPFDPVVIDLPGRGPEDVAIHPDGSVFVGVDDGRILRLGRTSRPEQVAETGGRPLGIEIHPDGGLIVCDCTRGLLEVDPDTGGVEILVDSFQGERLKFCNNSTVARDGTIYFTDSSTRFGQPEYVADLLEHSGTGRLFRRDISGSVDLVADGLDFANGVTLSRDEDFLIVAETGGYRLTRIWLTGGRAGDQEVFVGNLPGLPDNVSTGDGGLIWVALPSPRSRSLDALLPRPTWLRKLVWALPKKLRPKDTPTAWVQAYDSDGALVHDLQTTHPKLRMVSGVRESAGTVWLGSLESSTVGFFVL
ncbi:MAG: SMP-30/gluconolactonase/LRE family protein [Nakamurella sp.]